MKTGRRTVLEVEDLLLSHSRREFLITAKGMITEDKYEYLKIDMYEHSVHSAETGLSGLCGWMVRQEIGISGGDSED